MKATLLRAIALSLAVAYTHALVPDYHWEPATPTLSEEYPTTLRQGHHVEQPAPAFGEVDLPLSGDGNLPHRWMVPEERVQQSKHNPYGYLLQDNYQIQPVPSQGFDQIGLPPSDYHGSYDPMLAYVEDPGRVYQDPALQWDQRQAAFHLGQYDPHSGGNFPHQYVGETSNVHPQMHGYFTLKGAPVAAEEEAGTSSSRQKRRGKGTEPPNKEAKAERKATRTALLAYMAEEGLSNDTHPQELAAMVTRFKILHPGKENPLGQMASKIVRDWGNPEYYHDFYAWITCYRNHMKNLRKTKAKSRLSEAQLQQFYLDHFRDIFAGHHGTLADARLEAKELALAYAVWADFQRYRLPVAQANADLDMPTIAAYSRGYKYSSHVSHHDSLKYIKKYLRQVRGVPFTDIEVLTNLTLPAYKGGRHAHQYDRDLTA